MPYATPPRSVAPETLAFSPMGETFRVVVAGGGVAGLEAILALRDLAGDRVALTLVSPEREFVFRPMSVAAPFSRGHAALHPLATAARHTGADLVRARVTAVDPGEREVVLEDGGRLGYDALLVAVGARSETALRHALTWTPETDHELFGGLLRDLEERYVTSVGFIVPPVVAWPLPAYELALMTGWEARGMGADVDVTIYTPEDAPLAIFGTAASDALRAELEEVGIRVVTGARVEDADRGLAIDGRPLESQRAVALPRAIGPALPGLPADDAGFIPADPQGKVVGVDAVWVAGDAMAFPVKQGGLAAQEADAAAEAIAADAGADVEPQPFRPVLRGVLLTGRGRQWMRLGAGEEEGETARHALWWPPTKVAGRYLSPYLGALEDAEVLGTAATPDGHPVELDLTH
jgi:sulfide:quinone oxidoreductase